MNKGTKTFIAVLFVIIALLAASSGFLFAQNRQLKQIDNSDKKISTSEDAIPGSGDDTFVVNGTNSGGESALEDEPESTSAVTSPAPLGSRPSSPTDTYKIETGETLFSIGQKFDLTWMQIAEASGIEDVNKIQAGQSLIIPKNNQVSFTIDSSKAKDIQARVDGGADSFRLSALDTAKSDSSPVYGISPELSFKESKVDASTGTATILAVKSDNKTYEIKLTQPATKGEKGIWAIESIRPTQ